MTMFEILTKEIRKALFEAEEARKTMINTLTF